MQQEYLDELKQLQLMWERFGDHITNDPNASPSGHAPPALMESIEALYAYHMENMGVYPPDMVTFKKLAHLGEMMFYFGQFCHQNGLYRSNMTACHYDTVDDDAINAFLDGVKFTKEDE
jgi:hypothetical protein